MNAVVVVVVVVVNVVDVVDVVDVVVEELKDFIRHFRVVLKCVLMFKITL